MSLSSVLTEKTVAVGLSSRDKQGMIEEMLDLLVEAGSISDRAAALSAILERERTMSTGMKYGIFQKSGTLRFTRQRTSPHIHHDPVSTGKNRAPPPISGRGKPAF